MFICKLTVVLLITFSHLGQVRSQDAGPTKSFENGPTGISVMVEEDLLRNGESPRPVINGPNGYSVEAQEGKLKEFEEEETDLLDSNDAAEPEFKETDIDLTNLDNEDERQTVNGHTGSSVQYQQQNPGNRGVISTDPKENEDKKLQRTKGYHIDETDWSTDSSNWDFKGWELVNLPDESHPGLPAPLIPGPALVVDSNHHKKVNVRRTIEDLHNVTLHYSYFLSEGELPDGVPTLQVFQVRDGEQVYQFPPENTYGIWHDNLIHLEGPPPYEIIFQGQLKKSGNEIALDDISLSGNYIGETAVKDGDQEVHGKDSIDALSEAPGGVSSAPEEGQGGENGNINSEQVDTGTGKPDETGITGKPEEVVEGLGSTQQLPTVVPEDVGEITEKPGEAGLPTNNSDVVMQGNDTLDRVNGTGMFVQGNETYETGIPEFTNNPEQVNETISIQDPIQGNVTESSQYTSASLMEVAAVDNETNITEATEKITELVENVTVTSGGLDNLTEAPEISQTVGDNVTADPDVSNGENVTGVEYLTLPFTNLTENPDIAISLLPTNMTEFPDYDITNNLTNGLIDTSSNPDTVTSLPPVLINQTGPEVIVNETNSTEAPTNNATGGGDNSTSPYLTTAIATPDISPLGNATTDQETNSNATSNPPLGNATTDQETNSNATSNPPLGNATTDQETNSNATSTPLVMINSTFPSGSNGTSSDNITGLGNTTSLPGGSIGDSSSSSGSWSTFKVFIVICILGVGVVGFLYWRRQRRRDDEIPVFSRATHTDYHNPTFSDDDANFASRGTGNNYKSFD